MVEGVNSQRLGGEQQAAATVVVTDTLTLPDGLSDGLWLQITDAAGREVCRLPRAQNVVVSALAPGSYRLNIIGRKGAAHPAMRFWKAASDVCSSDLPKTQKTGERAWRTKNKCYLCRQKGV